MNVTIAGLNHKSAPVDIRERLAFDFDDTTRALNLLKDKFPDREFVLLSTCHRVELYSAGPSSASVEELADFLLEFHGLNPEDYRKFLYTYQDKDAVRHFLKVISSLDSMVVGESQIITQVKESYSAACKLKTTGKILNRLFHNGFATAKKVHTITSISNGRTSVAGVAVELAMQLFDDISSAKALVIGAGQMGELLIQHLLHVNCSDIVVVNRSYEKALDMAERYNIRGVKWDQLESSLMNANILIASAAVQDYLFKKDSFSQLISNRKAGPLLVIDIAVPRNFEPGINELETVYLYSIDDLSTVVEQNLKMRQKDITHAIQIVEENVTDYIDWFRARDIGPLIGRMRSEFARISEKELSRFFVGVRCEASCKDVAESMVKRIVNRLLHCVIKNVETVSRKHGSSEAAKMVDNIVKEAEEILSGLDNDEGGKS